MFVFKKNLATTDFIRSIQSGFIIYKPSVHVCKVKYNISKYNDALYPDFSIPFPKGFSTSTIKRRAEYLAGRITAQTLLQEENISTIVTSQNDRSPKWPKYWNGSISHTNKYAITVIAPISKGIILGVDIEEFNSSGLQKIADLFINPIEQKLISKTNINYDMALLIAFSAKESLFKALYPSVKKLFSFDAAIICKIGIENQSFTLKLTQSLSADLSAGLYFNGHYQFHDGNVITLIAEELL